MFIPLLLLYFVQIVCISAQNDQVNISVGENYIDLSWTEKDPGVNFSILYGVVGNMTMEDTTVSPQDSSVVTHRISPLTPGVRYQIGISRNGVLFYNTTKTTKPLPPTNITVVEAGSSFLYIRWTTSPNSHQDSFHVFTTGVTNSSQVYKSGTLTSTVYNITGLSPGHVYTVTVVTSSGGELSQFTAQIVDNTAPLSPSIQFLIALDNSSLMLSWQTDPRSNETLEDEIILTATYNNTLGIKTEVDLSCRLILLSCLTTVPGIPGQVYLIKVYGVLNGRRSIPGSVYHSTRPDPVLDVKEITSATTKLELELVPPVVSEFQNYFIQMSSDSSSILDENFTRPRTTNLFVVSQLQPGTIYDFLFSTSTDYESSTPLQRTFYTDPLPPAELYLDDKNIMNTSLTFTWDPVANGSLEYYEIGITPKETSTVSPVRKYDLGDRRVDFTGLVAGKKYIVNIISGLKKKTSQLITRVVYTVPNPPEGLSINASGGRSLDVTWSRPSLGHVERYNVTLYPTTENSSKVQTVTVTSTHYKFTGLHPGQTYRITVMSESGNVQSSAISDYGITFPSTVAELFIDEVGTDSINISWSKPEGTVFDTYRLTIYPAHTTSPISIPQSSGILHHNFVGLNPGTIYNVTVQTIVNHSSSDQAQVTVITIPLPVQDLNASTHDSNSLYVEWRTPAIIQQEFFVASYQVVTGQESDNTIIRSLHDQTKYSKHIHNLLAGRMYTVSIQAVQVFNDMTANSTWETVNKTTKPKPITNLSAVLVGRNVQLSWQPGNDSMQDHYYIWYRPTLVTFGSTWYQKATTSESYLLTDMFPGQQYEILIFAVSYGEMSSQKTTYVQIPPLPPVNISVVKEKTNTSSFTLQWIYDANSTYVDHWSVEYQSYNNGPMQSTTVPSMSAGLDDSVIVTLGSLVSGETYKVVIRSIVQNSSSEKVDVNVTIRPNVMTSLSEDVYTTSSAISLTYSAATNFFQYYIFHITNMSSIQPIKKDKSDLNRSILFTGLEGGTLYQVSVVTVSGDQISDPKYINLQTYPNIPHVENTRTPYSINITLNRHKDQGFLDHVVVGCHLNGVSCGTSTQVASSDMSPITAFFDKLTPYTKYAFQIIAVAGSKNDSLYLEIWTLQTAPSAVQNLHAAETNKLTVNLSWSPPLEKNGELTAYLVSYTGVMGGNTDDTGSRNVTVSADMVSQDMSLQFTQLKAGFTYTFQVHAKTITYGEVAKVTLTMKTYAPVFKDGVTVASATPKKITDKSITAVTPSTIVVNFTNAFSDQYGDIIQYTVIVATDTSNKYTDTHVLPSYKAFQNDPSLKAYQAISNCSEFFLQESTCGGKFRIHKRSAVNVEYKVFEIGTEANCKDIYCNGPLRQQTKYFIKLRAYTTGGYSDTEYSEPIITGVVEETVNAAPIVVSILLAVVVIVVAIVIFIIFRRKMREKSNMYRQGNSNILTPRSSLTSSRKNHAVSVMDFREHIKMMSADSDFKYAEEFEDLKEIGRGQPTHAAELPVNRGKNRFTNILPYDHSRVKLLPTDDEEGSDYMNANYMPGYNSRREYIVTQGPLPSTRDDFWRMIWEQNVRNIVMLTRCMEKGREKCDQYWPTGTDAMFYGDLQVAALNETKFPSWSITEFKISLGDVSRQIRHFHFVAWPDFGVPDNPQILVRFVRTVREKLFKDCGPIVVHCSAGVGRSGTFIVLDRILQHIKHHDTLDIFSIVAEMRKERVWMVQTEQQYVCIHQCILCVVDGREDEHIYQNAGVANAAYEDDEGINVEVP